MIESIPAASLLLHPNVPKPLHGVNPRSVLGKDWWDRTRKAAYARFDYHCWACGIHKHEAGYYHWLEGHEYYQYDYARGRAVMVEVVALCHPCHKFIHGGQMWMQLIQGGDDSDMTVEKFWTILYRGFITLKRAGLPPNPFAVNIGLTALQSLGTGPVWTAGLEAQAARHPIEDGYTADWEDWRLVIEDREYPPLYASYHAWLEHYNPKAAARHVARPVVSGQYLPDEYDGDFFGFP